MSLFASLRATARVFPGRPFLIDQGVELSYQEALYLTLRAAKRLRSVEGERVYFYARDAAAVVIGLCAADLAGVTVCVLNRRDNVDVIRDTMDAVGAGFLFTDHPRMAGLRQGVASIGEMMPETMGDDTVQDDGGTASKGNIIVLTTGTTGRPKAALYSWTRLVNQLQKVSEDSHRTWLLTYPLNHFAGIQVVLHSVVNGHTLVMPSSRQLEEFVKAIRMHGVDSISGTPTFWRMFTGRLKAREAEALHLKQITLGGEASTPELLARLKRVFTGAAITQVYATTELGACFSVKDGEPGFPASFLERNVGNVRLKIVDGELYVQSRNRMLGYVGRDDFASDDEWIATGDMVELIGSRVLFRGRKSEIINVGGYKVHPGKVEAVILQVDGVQAVRVFGRPNPITGQLVAAALEPAQGIDDVSLVKKVREACALHLGRAEQPREIDIREALEKRNGKIVRSLG